MSVMKILRFIAKMTVLLLLLVGCSSGAAQVSSNFQKQGNTMNNSEHKTLFEALLKLRDQDFVSARTKLFANPASVAYLKEKFSDPDRVVAFVARELHSWATELPKEYTDLETFLQITEPLLRKASKTAKGGGGSDALHNYLAPYRENRKAIEKKLLNHLLLRALMQPNLHAYIYILLQQYYSFFPVPEPEVWIRISLEISDQLTFDFLVDKSLPLIDQKKLKHALEHERVRAIHSKVQWPEQFDSLRMTLR